MCQKLNKRETMCYACTESADTGVWVITEGSSQNIGRLLFSSVNARVYSNPKKCLTRIFMCLIISVMQDWQDRLPHIEPLDQKYFHWIFLQSILYSLLWSKTNFTGAQEVHQLMSQSLCIIQFWPRFEIFSGRALWGQYVESVTVKTN